MFRLKLFWPRGHSRGLTRHIDSHRFSPFFFTKYSSREVGWGASFRKKMTTNAESLTFVSLVDCTAVCVVQCRHLPLCTLTHLLSVSVKLVGDAMFLSSATHPDHESDQPSD